MKDFDKKIAVVTGGGTGMGRELVHQLIAAGAHVAMCDVSAENMAQTAELANVGEGQRLTSHLCDVSIEAQMNKFRDEVVEQHATEHRRRPHRTSAPARQAERAAGLPPPPVACPRLA